MLNSTVALTFEQRQAVLALNVIIIDIAMIYLMASTSAEFSVEHIPTARGVESPTCSPRAGNGYAHMVWSRIGGDYWHIYVHLILCNVASELEVIRRT